MFEVIREYIWQLIFLVLKSPYKLLMKDNILLIFLKESSWLVEMNKIDNKVTTF